MAETRTMTLKTLPHHQANMETELQAQIPGIDRVISEYSVVCLHLPILQSQCAMPPR